MDYKKSAAKWLPCLNKQLKNNHKQNGTIKDGKEKRRNSKSAFEEVSEEDEEDTMKQALMDQDVSYGFIYGVMPCSHFSSLASSDRSVLYLVMCSYKMLGIPEHQVLSCKLSSDTKYLESIPQSCNYLVRGLQNKLIKCGVLKNQEDCEDFRMLIPQGCRSSQLKEKPEDRKSKMMASKSLPSCACVRTRGEQPAAVSLSQRHGQLKKRPARAQESACCQHLPRHRKHTKPQKETEQIFPKLQISGPSELQKRPEELLQTGEEVNYLFPREHKSPGATEKEMEENILSVLARKKQQGQYCNRSSKACKAFDELRNEDNGVTEILEYLKSSVSALAPQETNPVPLTLQEVALKHPVLEAESRLARTNHADKEGIS